MAARRALLPLPRLLLLNSRGHSQSCKPDPGSPPCAPCERVAAPPCRAQPRRTRPALRVTCCAPQPRRPPPCVPQEQQLTCHHARTVSEKQELPFESSLCNSGCVSAEPKRCGAELDRVARRLAAAESARREHYEREVTAPAPPDAAPPATPYRLVPERECVRATDGCDYTLAANAYSENQCPRCGPDRRPPAPRLTALTPSDACEPDRGLEMDPCAHRPRVLLHVDRSPPERVLQPPTPSTLPPEDVARKRPSPRERLTTRIMESLNLKRENKISCPKSTCNVGPTETRGRCANLPKPVAAPPRCREPSIVEQLRRRPGMATGSRCGDSRRIHTSTSLSVQSGACGSSAGASRSTAPDTGVSKSYTTNGLNEMLRQRSELKEAARGRLAGLEGAAGRPEGSGAGQLELRIPPTSESVRVRVSLELLPPRPASCASSATAVTTRALTSGGNDSWLSIRGMQKKWSGYRKHDTSSKSCTADETPAARSRCSTPTGPESTRGRSAGGASAGKKHDCGSSCPPISPRRCCSALEFSQILC